MRVKISSSITNLTRIKTGITQLEARLAELETEIAALQAAGEILQNGRIDSSFLGGITVREWPPVQYRLRVQGQKARYLKAD